MDQPEIDQEIELLEFFSEERLRRAGDDMLVITRIRRRLTKEVQDFPNFYPNGTLKDFVEHLRVNAAFSKASPTLVHGLGPIPNRYILHCLEEAHISFR